jgi:DNA-binding beta-propeller fold protein YncE
MRRFGLRAAVRFLNLAASIAFVVTAPRANFAQVIIPNTPQATTLSGNPWGIRAEWRIGGEGTWDYLTVDPVAAQLFIAHGPQVQIVDLHSGERVTSITGLGEARDVVLDPAGAYAFISDAKTAQVHVLDRRTLEMIASVATGPTPRALVYEPQTQLVFAICAAPVAATSETAPQTARQKRANGVRRHPPVRSTVTVIDARNWKLLGSFQVSGRLGFGEADGRGNVFMTVEDRRTVVRFDAATVARQLRTGESPSPRADSIRSGDTSSVSGSSTGTGSGADAASRDDLHGTAWDPLMRRFILPDQCTEPSALALDTNHLRLFVGCENGHLEVLDAESGSLVASVAIGLDPGTVLYDAARGLVFTANGGDDGSISIIRQDINDNYALVQQLITRPRARTMAENFSAGRLYLVTDIYGFDLSEPSGIGTLKTLPMPGSFEVIVVGPVGAP